MVLCIVSWYRTTCENPFNQVTILTFFIWHCCGGRAFVVYEKETVGVGFPTERKSLCKYIKYFYIIYIFSDCGFYFPSLLKLWLLTCFLWMKKLLGGERRKTKYKALSWITRNTEYFWRFLGKVGFKGFEIEQS